MQIVFGTLSLRGLSSFLMPQQAWLLMAGFPDPQQAGYAATNFIVNVRHLPDRSPVAVTGMPSSIGQQPVIVMSDINAAGSLMAHAVAAGMVPPAPQAATAPTGKASRQRAPQAGPTPGRRKAAPAKP
jgi:hypothetical protein